MEFDTAYKVVREEVDKIKSVNGCDNLVTVMDKEFLVHEARGYPKGCQIWGHREGKNGLVCIGYAQLGRCKTFSDVKHMIAKRIAKELSNPTEFKKPTVRPKHNPIAKEWHIEIARMPGNFYFAKMTLDGKEVTGMPEYARFVDIRDFVLHNTGIEIPRVKDLVFDKKDGERRIATIDSRKEETQA